MSLVDVVAALFFLLALIAVSRLRKYVTDKDKQSYYHVVGGLSILAVVALAQIYNRMGAMQALPFVSDPVFFKLLFCIGLITGMVLLVDGVSNWAPLSKSYRKFNKERVRRFELLATVQKLVRVEHRLPVLLEGTLTHMIESHGLSQGAAWVYSANSGEFAYTTSSGFAPDAVTEPSGIVFNADRFPKLTAGEELQPDTMIERLPDNMRRPDLLVPLMAGNRPAGVLALWKKKSAAIYGEDKVNLKLAADIVGQKLYGDMLRLKNDFYSETQQWGRELKSAIDFHADPKTCLTTLADQMAHRLSVDFISLVIVHRDRTAHRYTTGLDGGVLSQRRLDFDALESVTSLVYADCRPVFVDDIEKSPELRLDKIVAGRSLRSLAVVPVDPGSGAIGVLTVGATKPAQYGAREAMIFDAVVPVLAHLATEERHRYDQNIVARRNFLVNNFVGELSELGAWQEAFTRAAQMLSEELKSTVVRISTVDSRGAFLNSQALETARPIAGIAPVSGSMILSLMPYHQLVMDTGRPMMINQESTDRKMTDLEAKQVFGVDLKSSLLVPVKVGERVIAVVSLAEVRNWHRFQFRQADIQFVNAIAGVLGMAVQLTGKRARAVATNTAKLSAKSIRADATRLNRIRSSLSGIMGSVEILRTSKQPNGENLEKCLSIIDRSAQRINECFPAE